MAPSLPNINIMKEKQTITLLAPCNTFKAASSPKFNRRKIKTQFLRRNKNYSTYPNNEKWKFFNLKILEWIKT